MHLLTLPAIDLLCAHIIFKTPALSIGSSRNLQLNVRQDGRAQCKVRASTSRKVETHRTGGGLEQKSSPKQMKEQRESMLRRVKRAHEQLILEDVNARLEGEGTRRLVHAEQCRPHQTSNFTTA